MGFEVVVGSWSCPTLYCPQYVDFATSEVLQEGNTLDKECRQNVIHWIWSIVQKEIHYICNVVQKNKNVKRVITETALRASIKMLFRPLQ